MSNNTNNADIGKKMEMEPFQIVKGAAICDQSTVYIIEKVLGSGAYGKVAMCIKQDTGETVAVKLVKEKDGKDVQKEASIFDYLKKADPEANNMIKLFNSFHYKEYYCLVFELLDSNLHDILTEGDDKPVRVSKIRIIAKQMLLALSALKSVGVTHRDIKPDNIMLADRTSQPQQFKLIDFGLACMTPELAKFGRIQAKQYRAPEVYLGLPLDEGVDMWALGCALAFLFLGRHLFLSSNEYEILSFMIKLLGMPDKDALDKGCHVSNFFIQEQMGTQTIWRLKTKGEYMKQTGLFNRRTIPDSDILDSLDDLLKIIPAIENPTELEDAKAFLDLLKKMLAINPEDRIQPDDALNHPFITMEYFANSYMREALEIMTGFKLTDPDKVSPDSGNQVVISNERDSSTNVRRDLEVIIIDSNSKSSDVIEIPLDSESSDQMENPLNSKSRDQRVCPLGSKSSDEVESPLDSKSSDQMESPPLILNEDIYIRDESTLYTVQKVLGFGSFGKVAMCRTEDTGEMVALKFVKQSDHAEVMAEVEALSYLQKNDPQGKYLMKFFNCFRYQEYYCLVFELLDSSLYDLMHKADYTPFKVFDIRVIAKQMLLALETLKRLRVTHRDLKPDNIMLVDQKSRPQQFKLIDFGLACMTSELSSSETIQNNSYRAPEVYLGLHQDEGVDMWALGCTLAFLFIGNHLFSAASKYEILRFMFKILGMPNRDVLDKGCHVPDFFTQVQMGTQKIWRLKSKKEYEEHTGSSVDRIDTDFDKLESLDDLLEMGPEIESSTELEDAKAFIDLLKKMLAINPEDRIQPSDALNHPFITMEHLTNRQDPYVRVSMEVMEGYPPVNPCSVSTATKRKRTTSSEQNHLSSAHEESEDIVTHDTEINTKKRHFRSSDSPTASPQKKKRTLSMSPAEDREKTTSSEQRGKNYHLSAHKESEEILTHDTEINNKKRRFRSTDSPNASPQKKKRTLSTSPAEDGEKNTSSEQRVNNNHLSSAHKESEEILTHDTEINNKKRRFRSTDSPNASPQKKKRTLSTSPAEDGEKNTSSEQRVNNNHLSSAHKESEEILTHDTDINNKQRCFRSTFSPTASPPKKKKL